VKKFLLFVLAIIGFSIANAQNTVSGIIADSEKQPLPGASVVEKGTSNGIAADINGKYTLSVGANATLIFGFVGFYNQEIVVGNQTTINISLKAQELGEVVIVGSRSAPRSSTDTPLPVDVVGARELVSTGQTSFDKALQYRIPSFNTVQTPVNDATALLDPYEIRNMGPSRTLILVNGKRKNLSALLYTQTSPGRGETGADISAIPTDAIERVEILRDGASAQYGSDAIAGVMNIILKDDVDYGSLTLRTGITSEGDGSMYGVSLNGGTSVGDDKGFVNYTVDLSKVNLANRPGTVSAIGEAMDFGAPLSVVQEFLGRQPDAGNINGSPETTSAKFLVNGGVDLSGTTELYFNAAYVYKKVNSYANYRTPYWRTVADCPYLADFFPAPGTPNNYDGYLPTFDGDLNDYNGTVGFKGKKNDWNYDASVTVGGNRQTYMVRNSQNGNLVYSPAQWIDANGDGVVDPGEMVPSSSIYQENSKINFDPGGTAFNHIVGNIDISKVISDHFSIGFGSEFRTETFEVIEGELASYDGGGADSFAGNNPENSGEFNRYNFGAYFDVAWDITKDFLINGTVRTENYSDFGNAFVWKVSSRYKFLDDKITVRGSASTGFRAPTLHQIYTQKAQYSFVPGAGILVGGLISNVSPQARLLEVPQLTPEESFNVTGGFGVKLSRNLNFTLDYYDISVTDRIILSNELAPPNTPTFNGLSDVSFFVNAIDTHTSGVDFVAAYRNVALGSGKIHFNLSGNYTIANERVGDVRNPPFAANSGQSVVDATQEALFFTSRPKTKWILGAHYEIGKFGFALNGTFFGKTTFKQSGMDSNLRTEFKPNIITDLAVTFHPTDQFTIALNLNNLLNVLPEWSFVSENAAGQAIINSTTPEANGLTPIENQSNLITFNQRYSQMTYTGFQFSQLGMMMNLSFNYRF
jgi:iron complex outermembrane receptor protein